MASVRKRLAPITTAFLLMAGAASAEDTFKYGLVSAFSGPAGAWGEMMETSVQLAVEDINADGGIRVHGKAYPIQLYKYDHAYDPTKGVTVVRQAIQQDGLRYLEVLGGGIIPAVQPITEPAKALVFGIAGGETWIGTRTPHTFKTYFDGARGAIAILEAAKQKHTSIKTVLLMYPEDDVGHSMAKTVTTEAEKIGFELETLFTARDVTDFYPIALKIMQNPPDVIDFGVTPGAQYSQMIRQLRENGFQGIFSFSGSLDAEPLIKAGVVDLVLGGYSAPFWEDFKSEQGKSWMERYKKRYGSVPMWTAQEYDSLWLLKAAIEKAGTFEDTEKVAAALGEVEIEGLGGKVRYGGADLYGLPRAFVSDIPVAELHKDGDAFKFEQVSIYKQ